MSNEHEVRALRAADACASRILRPVADQTARHRHVAREVFAAIQGEHAAISDMIRTLAVDRGEFNLRAKLLELAAGLVNQ